MCGVPFHSVNQYINRLANLGYKLLICEQIEDKNQTKGIVKRAITQYITPGTKTDLNSMEAKTNNYLMSLAFDLQNFALVFADITTGLSKACAFSKIRGISSYIEEILKYEASEILISKDFSQSQDGKEIIKHLRKNNLFITELELGQFQDSKNEYAEIFINSSRLIDYENKALKEAAFGLYSYILKTQGQIVSNLKQIDLYQQNNFVFLPQEAIKSLELFSSIRSLQKNNSLLASLDKCKTAMGSRLLKRMLEQILCDKDKIIERQKIVSLFKKAYTLRQDLRKELQNVGDIERLSLKMQDQSINPRQFLQLARTLKSSAIIWQTLQEFWPDNEEKVSFIFNFKEDTDFILKHSTYLNMALADNPPVLLKDGGIFKSSYDENLAEYRELSVNGQEKILELEQEMKDKYQIKNVKIGYNRVFGYYFEVAKSSLHLVPDSFTRKQTLANVERFINEDLKNLEDKVLGAQSKLIEYEQYLFIELKKDMPTYQELFRFSKRPCFN